MNNANAKLVKLVVVVYLNFLSHLAKIEPKTRGGQNSKKNDFILPKIPLIVILSDREKLLQI